MVNAFSEIAGYKINIQKLIAFSYANNQLSEREIKKTIPFTIASKKNKIHSNKINQEFKRPVLGKYKTLKKEIEEDTNKWKYIPCS